ncbi:MULTISPECIES: twin-arginine translocase TatA/TatE family subunit [unclassified Dehalobacter]|uniref:Sec-independent protein translocase subunit TatA/TatB n=1 Tax=unclassified Dehalobacter TaxID=2635733 RepID=UPI000E6B8087|nr:MULTISPECIES: twin-arginine translocase TatA/TatE family subunit [unclassified Dehalobacter]RJE48636.1 Twin-arginine translocation protein [Dehalobacter sp. MCB1]TCX53441.1 Twin-arginine translocation protein [Dehalobacter sp. 14DCB1]TCX54790.1 Twin-arginine translocation protein [Dehalobacter sp. 12DCB1]
MGLTEIALILFVALILFGPDDLPVIAKTIGKMVRQGRKIMNELTREFTNTMSMQSDTIMDSLKDTSPKEKVSQEEPKQKEDTNVLQSNDGGAEKKAEDNETAVKHDGTNEADPM